ncbi:unnamed protein product [Lasius platythorax]|uniref:Uncharacterized protein n=2 Tax=Lasius TaxID=488720 RepID=A0AAV2MXF6_9HYME|nr:putative transposon-derived protein [Lasius niger]
MLTYSSEAWILTEKTINKINVFERKILRQILGPKREGENWRIRYNHEIYQQYKDPPLSDFIKLQKLRWAGNVIRMENNRLPQKALNSKIFGKKPVGKPRK